MVGGESDTDRRGGAEGQAISRSEGEQRARPVSRLSGVLRLRPCARDTRHHTRCPPRSYAASLMAQAEDAMSALSVARVGRRKTDRRRGDGLSFRFYHQVPSVRCPSLAKHHSHLVAQSGRPRSAGHRRFPSVSRIGPWSPAAARGPRNHRAREYPRPALGVNQSSPGSRNCVT